MKLSEQIQYLEAMSFGDALKIVRKHDKDFPSNPDTATINTYRKKFAKKFHPDIFNDTETLKDINTALDTLKKGSGRDEYERHNSSKKEGVPVWQTDSRSAYNKINQEDYSDLNYIMKKAWELSGSNPNPTERDKTTFWNFDGKYSRGAFTVYANQRRPVQREIAKAMLKWDWINPNSKAVIAIPFGATSVTVFPVIDGDVEDSFDMPFGDSFNRNPFNDQQFVKRLQDWIERFLKER